MRPLVCEDGLAVLGQVAFRDHYVAPPAYGGDVAIYAHQCGAVVELLAAAAARKPSQLHHGAECETCHGRHPQQVGHSRNLPPRYVKTSRFSVRGCRRRHRSGRFLCHGSGVGCRSRKRVGRDGCQRFGAARRFGNGSCGGNGSVRYRDSRLRAHLRGGQRAAYRYDAQRQHERHGRCGQHQTTVEGVERLTAQQQFEEKVEDRDAESRLEAVCQKIRCHVICRFVVRCGRSARATRRPR